MSDKASTLAKIDAARAEAGAIGAVSTVAKLDLVRAEVEAIGVSTPPAIVTEVVNIKRIVALDAWSQADDNYARMQAEPLPGAPTYLSGATARVRFAVKFSATRKLIGGLYLLKFYDTADRGVVTFSTTVPASTVSQAFFDISLAGIPEGWYRLQLVCPAGEDAPSAFVFRYVDGKSVHTLMPACSSSYDIVHFARGKTTAEPDRRECKWAWMPARLTPTPRPRAPRQYPAFPTSLFADNMVIDPNADPPLTGTQKNAIAARVGTLMHKRDIVPPKVDDIRRPHKSKGVWSTFNRQAYKWSAFLAQTPETLLLDGPRGVGTLSWSTHLMPSLRDDSAKVYFSDPWRFGRIDEDGKITTIAGFRHNAITHELELVGDWSAVPPSLRQLWECWGAAVRKSTIALDPNAPPIGGEQPHLGPVDFFVTSPQNGAVFRVRLGGADGRDRNATAKITVFCSGRGDGWDLVEHNEIVYLTERSRDSVSMWDASKDEDAPGGNFIGWLVGDGTSLGKVKPSVRVYYATDAQLPAVRADLRVAFEGIWYDEASNAVECGSRAMRNIVSVDTQTGARAQVLDLSQYMAGLPDANFVKFAKGPLGQRAVSMWSNARFGLPHVFRADGREWRPMLNGAPAQGKGPYFRSYGYNAAVGWDWKRERILIGGAAEGVAELSMALPTDVAANQSVYAQGEKEFIDSGHYLFGEHDQDYYGFDTPRSAARLAYAVNNA